LINGSIVTVPGEDHEGRQAKLVDQVARAAASRILDERESSAEGPIP